MSFLSFRVDCASEKFITAMKGEIKNIVSESNFSEKNISVSQEKTKKGRKHIMQEEEEYAEKVEVQNEEDDNDYETRSLRSISHQSSLFHTHFS